MKKFEYRIIGIFPEEHPADALENLNLHGSQGWEVSAVFPGKQFTGGLGQCQQVIFKREIPESKITA